MTFSEVFDWIGKIITLLIFVFGIFAFAFKKYISEWIKSRFQTQLAKENESFKHDLVRELEAYKASLLRELEEYKLGIDIRRNISLAVSNQLVEAYQKICSQYGPIFTSIYTYSILDEEIREPIEEFRLRIIALFDQARSVENSYDFFLDPNKIGIPLSNLYKSTMQLLKKDSVSTDEAEKLIENYSNLTSTMRSFIRLE